MVIKKIPKLEPSSFLEDRPEVQVEASSGNVILRVLGSRNTWVELEPAMAKRLGEELVKAAEAGKV